MDSTDPEFGGRIIKTTFTEQLLAYDPGKSSMV